MATSEKTNHVFQQPVKNVHMQLSWNCGTHKNKSYVFCKNVVCVCFCGLVTSLDRGPWSCETALGLELSARFRGAA